jgi:hypothetical protein
MGDTYVTDMGHYLDEGTLPVGIPAPARRLAEHFGRIVAAATARAAGPEFASAVPCRRRPRHRPCPGPIRIRRAQVPPRIEWHCVACHDRGRINGFLGSPWDLSNVPPDTEEDERGSLLLPAGEYRALLGIDVLDRDCEALLLRAEPEAGGLRIEASFDLLDYLQGFVAAAANHERRATRRRLLDHVYERLESELHGEPSDAGPLPKDFEALARRLLEGGLVVLGARATVQTSGARPRKEGSSDRQSGKGTPRRTRPSAAGKRETRAAIYQLKVTLRHIRPPIWRRVQVPAELTLARLHDIVQDVMGWTDSHLHSFEIRSERFGVPSPEDWSPVRDERRVRLADVLVAPKEQALYTYDFGDSWEHAIVIEKILEPEPGADYPLCVAGRRARPPEDIGGPWGYGHMLEALADPSDPEREEYLEWLDGPFDPKAFDLAEANHLLRQRFG